MIGSAEERACEHRNGQHRDALQFLWLAETDAVLNPEFNENLDRIVKRLDSLSSCGPSCFLLALLPPTTTTASRPATALLEKILLNEHTPENLYQRVLETYLPKHHQPFLLEVIAAAKIPEVHLEDDGCFGAASRVFRAGPF